MLYYKNKIVLENEHNDIITGLRKKYSFFTLSNSQDLSNLKGDNIICSASYLSNPGIRKYHFINLFKNLDELNKYLENSNFNINYYYFKPIENKETALKILEDIKNKHGL